MITNIFSYSGYLLSNITKNNVSRIDDHRTSFKRHIQNDVSITANFPGFSKRLNELIDYADIGVPLLKDKGRAAELAQIFDVSPMATADWIKKDKPPRDLALRQIVTYLLSESGLKCNPVKAQAWLKYGEEAVPSPLVDKNSWDITLGIMASTLVHAALVDLDVPLSSVVLDDAIGSIVELLKHYGIREASQIKPDHHEQILECVKKNLS